VSDTLAQAVRVERDGPVTVVTIDRPEARNAVDGPTAALLAEAFRSFEADDDAAVAILTGASGTFCAGADLKAIARGTGNRVVEQGDGPMGPTRMLLDKPVIAAVEGYAVAGGLELAVWCDLRVAARDSTFGVFCRRWGVPLVDGGTIRLPRLIGMSTALDMIITGRAVQGDEALQIGLANRVCEPGAALETARALAHEIAALPQRCVRADRRSAYEQWELSLDDALHNEYRHGRTVLEAGDAMAGAARFAAGAGRRHRRLLAFRVHQPRSSGQSAPRTQLLGREDRGDGRVEAVGCAEWGRRVDDVGGGQSGVARAAVGGGVVADDHRCRRRHLERGARGCEELRLGLHRAAFVGKRERVDEIDHRVRGEHGADVPAGIARHTHAQAARVRGRQRARAVGIRHPLPRVVEGAVERGTQPCHLGITRRVDHRPAAAPHRGIEVAAPSELGRRVRRRVDVGPDGRGLLGRQHHAQRRRLALHHSRSGRVAEQRVAEVEQYGPYCHAHAPLPLSAATSAST
jgi:enoyl-CoA hydratase